jgi:hypothetical protein
VDIISVSGSSNFTLINSPEPIIISEGVSSIIRGGVVSSGIIRNTLKLIKLQIVAPLTVTQIGPEVAPVGTVVVMMVVLAASTTAGVPLKVTIFFGSSESKFKPIMLTRSPS